MMFSISSVQIINDWQIGGEPTVKASRGRKLKAVGLELDSCFRRADRYCFRRIALSKFNVAEIGENLVLPESIASWTFDLDVAKGLKGGVPDDGEIGVIFAHTPSPDQVVLDLAALYRERGFVDAIAAFQPRIKNYDRGIGKWWDSQREIVLDVKDLPISAIECIGGRSSSISKLVRAIYGDAVTSRKTLALQNALGADETGRVPCWLSADKKDRIVRFWIEQADARRGRRRQERLAGR